MIHESDDIPFDKTGLVIVHEFKITRWLCVHVFLQEIHNFATDVRRTHSCVMARLRLTQRYRIWCGYLLHSEFEKQNNHAIIIPGDPQNVSKSTKNTVEVKIVFTEFLYQAINEQSINEIKMRYWYGAYISSQYVITSSLNIFGPGS